MTRELHVFNFTFWGGGGGGGGVDLYLFALSQEPLGICQHCCFMDRICVQVI